MGTENTDIDQQLSDCLIETIQAKCPDLEAKFQERREQITSSIKNKIAIAGGSISLYQAVENIVEETKKEILMDFAYGRYLTLMKDQNFIPVPRKGFDKATHGDNQASPYKYFRVIEKKGIKIGSKITYSSTRDQIHTVVKITSQCALVIEPVSDNEPKKRRASPYMCELVTP